MSPLLGLLLCIAGPDAEPEPPDLPEEPAEPEEPEAPEEPEEPAVPEPAATPQPAPAPASTTTPVFQATDTEAAPLAARSDDDDDDDGERKVKTREDGDWAMSFVFGGLAPMSISGINDFTVNRLLFSELGFRKVLPKVVIPFSVGAGVFSHRPSGTSSLGDVGLAASFAVLADFRRGKRVIPHAGAALHLHYVEPSGPSNYLINIALGPVIGIEYFFASRVSLLLQGKLNIGFNILDGLTQVDVATLVAAGGQMGLSFYF